MSDFDRAIADYTEAVKLHWLNIDPFVARGQAWEAKGQHAKAIDDYNKALAEKALSKAHQDAQALARTRLVALALKSAPPVSSELKAPTAAPVTAPPPPIRLGRRVALVIGNAAYLKWPRLENPGNDATAVAAALEKQLGFDKVILRRDLTADDFAAALDDFAKVVAGADLGMIYFAGHGMEVSGANYLIPVDARQPTAADLNLPGLPLDAVMRRLDGARKLKLVILDACRENPFGRGSGRGLKAIEPEGGDILVAYAAKAGTTAADDAGRGHSPFTQALLKHIATPGLEINFVFRRVRDDVMAATKRAQQPWTYGTLGGDPLYLHVKQ
jgi:hypothetical protein